MVFRQNKKKKDFSGKIFKAVTFFFCILLFYVLFFSFVPVKIFNYVHDDVHTSVDLAAVLFHDFDSTGKGLNKETKRRIHHGISLVNKDDIKYLLVSGGYRPDKDFSGAGLMAEYIESLGGLGAERIIVENTSRDSTTNLENISRVLDDMHLTSAGLVSSPLHLLRIKWTKKGFQDNLYFFPYDAVSCTPPLSGREIWYSVHYNLAAYTAFLILPENWYNKLVQWIRKHTEF